MSLQEDAEVLDNLRVQMQEHWPAFPPEGVYSALNSAVKAIHYLIKVAETSNHRVDL